MNKTKTALIVSLLLVGILLHTATAAATATTATLSYAVSTDRVVVDAGGAGSFGITIPAPAQEFAAVQFEVQLPEGVAISSVRYSESGTTISPTQSDTVAGLYAFSLFSASNVYSGAITCTIGISYNGPNERTITIKRVKQDRYTGAHTVASEVSQENARAVTVAPYGSSDVTPTPTPPPGGGASGGGGGGTSTQSGDGAVTPSTPTDGVDVEDDSGAGSPTDMPRPRPVLDRASGKAYIFGYPDGTFRPEARITRAETASMIYSIVDDSQKGLFAQSAFRFSDIDSGAWYAEAVGYLAEAGIILGYPDGTFRGENDITRAEFSTIISKFEQLTSTGGMPFSDVAADHWAYGFILSCYANEWIVGYPDGTFRPDAMIVRAEAVAIVNRAIGRNLSDYLSLGTKFTDVDPDEWYYADIVAASNDKP